MTTTMTMNMTMNTNHFVSDFETILRRSIDNASAIILIFNLQERRMHVGPVKHNPNTNANVFVDDFVNDFDEIVIKFKFNAMKLIEKSVVLSWVYLQPFCSTFFS